MRTTTSQAVEAYVLPLVKEKGLAIWDFKEDEDDLQEDRKSKCLVNKCLSCHVETRGHRGPAELPQPTISDPCSLYNSSFW